MDEFSEFTGDVSGPVTFHASATRTCDMTHLVAHGPFEGAVLQEHFRYISGAGR